MACIHFGESAWWNKMANRAANKIDGIRRKSGKRVLGKQFAKFIRQVFSLNVSGDIPMGDSLEIIKMKPVNAIGLELNGNDFQVAFSWLH